MEEGKEERKRRRRKGRGCPKRTTVLNHRTPQPSSRGEESQCPHLHPMEWCTSKLKASATHIRPSHSRSFFLFITQEKYVPPFPVPIRCASAYPQSASSVLLVLLQPPSTLLAPEVLLCTCLKKIDLLSQFF